MPTILFNILADLFLLLKELHGNSDSTTIVNNTIQNTMARYMKILPIFRATQDIICLKMEVYGCMSCGYLYQLFELSLDVITYWECN